MEHLIIFRTDYNIVVEHRGEHGITTAYKNFKAFKSEFNSGYWGGGPATTTMALLCILHNNQFDRRVKPIAELPGFTLIKELVTSLWYDYPLLSVQTLELTPEMISMFPFLRERKDQFYEEETIKHP